MPHQNERSRPGTTPDGSNAQQKVPTLAASHATSSGLQRAFDNADEWWRDGALLYIAQLAHDGGYVCACDVTDAGPLGLPDHPCRLGSVFAESARLGVITYVAHHRARRAPRHGGVHAVWRGVTR